MNNISFEGTWKDFKTQVYKAGADLLGFVKKQHKDWFDDNDANIEELLKIKRQLHQSLLSSYAEHHSAANKAYKEHKAVLQRELKKMKIDW